MNSIAREPIPRDAPSNALPDSTLTTFTADDLAELVVLQRCCWVSNNSS
ncbi:hypothetical protein [Nocardia terpenica]|nr:hypothetical protein [Nocardia terpenica]